MSELYLTLAYLPFYLIKAMNKREEIRLVKKYWTSRLKNNKYRTVRLTWGRGSSYPFMVFEFKGYDSVEDIDRWYGDVRVVSRGSNYVIKLGELLEFGFMEKFPLERFVECSRLLDLSDLVKSLLCGWL